MKFEELKEEFYWKLIELAEWQKDGNYKRIQKFYKDISEPYFTELENFAREKQGLLYHSFEDDWLGDPGIEVSDDGWNDLTAEVVGRGKKFYNSITVKKLQKMAKTHDYTENFFYSFQID